MSTTTPWVGTAPVPPDAQPRARTRGRGRRSAVRGSRDHALSLQRFLGALQLFGGLTLTAAYGLGAASLAVDWAPGVLVALGVLQMAFGLWFLLRVRFWRAVLLRFPGTFVMATLGLSTLIMTLGGSNRDTLFVTSGMCWLIAAGYLLPGYRWIVASIGSTAISTVVWIAVDGTTGGYNGNGEYLTAFLGLAAAVVPGLWLGTVTGTTSSTLNRWYLVERQERGLVERLRAQLLLVDHRSAALAESMPGEDLSTELTALRSRLERGLSVREESLASPAPDVLAEVIEDYRRAGPDAELRLELAPGVSAFELQVPAADALATVVRRQLLNVARHAPDARIITVHASAQQGDLVVRIEDDGHGVLPERAGTGTAWSARQLARVGGVARYYAAAAGVGLEVRVPALSAATASDVPGLSVREALNRFASGMLGALRWAGYIVDSLAAYAQSDVLGDRWLVMPAAAALMEVIIVFGVPGLKLAQDKRYLLAGIVVVAVSAFFTWPTPSPDLLITATTSVVILAQLIYSRRNLWWIGLEALRLVAVYPLVEREAATSIELVIIYPAAFSLVVLAMRRFADRAIGLEAAASDAMGRVALAGAAVRGLALRHDALDVVGRAPASGDAPELDVATEELERAVDDLAGIASDSLDPREAILAGIQAALPRPAVLGNGASGPSALAATAAAAAGAIDRITLIEIAALAADERLSCSPPGLLGRRRLRTLAIDWTADGRTTELELTALPSLRPPEPGSVQRLSALAEPLGIEVRSGAGSLVLSFTR